MASSGRNQEASREEPEQAAGPAARQARDDSAIYQNGRIVARATDPTVDMEAKEIRFAELSNSDELLLPDECEFQKYTIVVQRIAYAAKEDKGALHKGRVLRDVVAEILGYREV